MNSPLLMFPALYGATTLMLTGTGFFMTYLALRLNADAVSSLWIGALTAAYYAGMVGGAKVGHLLIAGVGHIRAYVACAGVSTIIVLLHVLIEDYTVWLVLRLVIGVAMMTQYMVIESWLNEQVNDLHRGIVFAGYMIAVSLGLIAGQLLMAWQPLLDARPLVLVAIFFSASLVPLALTRRVHPAKLVVAPLELVFFRRRIPQSLVTVFVAGVLGGAFYGLAPVYASQNGLDTSRASVFVAVAITAGFVAQWPMGWISDRVDRSRLISLNALALGVLSVPLWGLLPLNYAGLLLFGFLGGASLFTLYPLAVAFANDHIEQPKRVALSAMLLATHGVGASMGPLLAGALMKAFGAGAFYMMFSACALLLVAWVRPARVTGKHRVEEAPLQYVAMPEHPVSAVSAMLDPRVSGVPAEHLVEMPESIGSTPDGPA